MFTFWFGTIVFFGTYILIATEKVHKTVAALLGAVLMMLVILPGPGHSAKQEMPTAAPVVQKVVENSASDVQKETLPPAEGHRDFSIAEKVEKFNKMDYFARYSNFDVVFTLAGMMILVNLLSGTGLFQYVAIKCAKLAKGSPVRTAVRLQSTL